MSDKVAVITGGNAGIGYAIADRLLEEDSSTHVCLACRSKPRADVARQSLLEKHVGANVEIIILDVSDPKSVYTAAEQIKQRYKHIDYLYMNAGVMPNVTMDWGYFFSNIFTKKAVNMLQTGEGLLKQTDGTTPEGLKQTFTTNLFGHFLLIRDLDPVLGSQSGRNSQIIWTSSSNAKRTNFDINDFQHCKGSQPYSSSKYAMDLLSLELNKRLNKKGVFSHSTCPGIVLTNLTYNIVSAWVWTLLLPIMWILRLFITNQTITSSNGAEALIWVANQKPESLDTMCRYNSRLSFLGKRYTEPTRLDIDAEEATELFKKLLNLEQEIQRKIKIKS